MRNLLRVGVILSSVGSLIFFLQPISSGSEGQSYASWVDLPASNSRIVATLRDAQKRKVPARDAVKIPPYPNAKLLLVQDFVSDAKKLNQELVSKQNALVLVTVDAPLTVVDWYRNTLTNFTYFEKNQAYFLVESLDNQSISKAEAQLYCSNHIVIKRISEPLRSALPKYKTTIDVGYRADSADAQSTAKREHCE